MNEVLGYALLSLATGALYGLTGCGVVVVQRGAGVLNIAQGALLAFGAYFFAATSGWGLPVALGALATVLVTAAIGLAFHVVVMRPLRDATSLTRLMATLGLLVVLQSLIGLLYGQGTRYSPTVLPGGKVGLAGQQIGVDVFVRLGVVAVIAAALWAAFRFTTLGLATTAVTENPRAAATFGWSPDAVAGTAWVVGSALAGLCAVLLAPLANPLDSLNLVLLVVPALAVALVARFRSMPGVLLGGLALAVAEIETQVHLVSQHPFWRGADQAIPLLVIVVYLVARGRGIPERGQVAERQPELGSGQVHWPALLALVAAAVALVWVLPADWVDAVNANALWALVILSVVVLAGFTGQLSLGQLAFSGIAALIAGRLVAIRGWPLEAALPLGVAGAAVVGLLFALPALRTRGLQLAVVTLGLGAAVDAILLQRGYHSPIAASTASAASAGASGPGGGTGGLASIFDKLGSPEGTLVGTQSFLGVTLDKITNPRGFATLSVVVFVLVALAVANLRRGRAGRRLIAVRTNERAAASLGISVVGAKLYAFALSAAIAGLGGVLYAFYLFGDAHNIDYGAGTFAPFPSILLIAYAVVGGVGWVSGSFAGAALAAGALTARLGRFVSDVLGSLSWLVRTLAAALGAALGYRLGRDAAVLPRGSRRPAGSRPPRGTWRPSRGGSGPAVEVPNGSGAAAVTASRRAPLLGAVVVAGVALAVGGRIEGWLTHLDRYMPLIGGLVLLSVLTRSKGGIAPENARAWRDALDARRPGRRDAARVRRALVLLGEPEPGHPLAARDPDSAAARDRAAAPGPTARRAAPAGLAITGLTVRFGAITAVDGLSLRIDPGQVVGLIGPNGAGKTTVVDAVTGYNRATVEAMTLGARRLDRLPAHRRARAGVARSFQSLELFGDLTVLENMQAASDRRDLRAYLTNLVGARRHPLPPAAVAAIDAFGLREDLVRRADELPYGRRRLLAIARAVAAEPSVLLLDEPCAGLDAHESAEVADLVRRLADEWGLAVLLNEHDMDVVMGICDHVIVLDAGRQIAAGTPDEIRRDRRVRLAYLGEPAEQAHPFETAPVSVGGGS
jgi:sulfate-transporting ATPase